MTYAPINCGKCGQPVDPEDETASRRRHYTMHEQCPLPESDDGKDQEVSIYTVHSLDDDGNPTIENYIDGVKINDREADT
jgi:hypothetical protein